MLSIYYKIWVDAIAFEQKKKQKETGWRTILLIIMSILQGTNLLALLFVFRWLSHRRMPIVLPVYFFNWNLFNTIVAVVLTFFVPFVLLNYLLIFYNKRYSTLLQIYPNKHGKLYRNYALISLGVIVIPLIFKFIFL
jgi:hypothetical protein